MHDNSVQENLINWKIWLPENCLPTQNDAQNDSILVANTQLIFFSIQVGSFEVVLPMKEVNQVTPCGKKRKSYEFLNQTHSFRKNYLEPENPMAWMEKMDDDYDDEFLKLDWIRVFHFL